MAIQLDIIPFGQDGLLINLEQEINVRIAEQVKGICQHLKGHKAINSIIPAFCSITLTYDRQKTDFQTLKTYVLSYQAEENATTSTSKLLNIPVCYEEAFGLDLPALAETLGLSSKELIDLHSHTTYHTYMIGFLPGFPYLGKTAEALTCKRLAQPRKQVAAGSVGLAGNQTGIYPIAAPGGWQIIGQTPLPIFKPHPKKDFLFEVGDKVKFSAITSKAFQAIEKDIQSGTFKWETLYD